MADVDVKMVFASMEEMAEAFHGAHQQVSQSIEEMNKIAQILEGGGLQGQGGDRFVAAIKGKLVPKMEELARKLQEEEKDIRGAEKATRRGEKDSKNRFLNS